MNAKFKMQNAKVNPKRPWFQIHLSTAVVLMFVAGGLLWPNMIPSEVFVSDSEHSFVPDFRTGSFITTCAETWHYWGWPYTVCRKRLWTVVSTSKKVPEEIEPKRFHGPGPLEMEWKSGLFNAVFALLILFASAMACEWPIRRKANQPPAIRRKANKPPTTDK